jgi:hypothetical protein
MTLAQYGTSAHTECSNLMRCHAVSIGKYSTGDFRSTFTVKDCMTVKIVYSATVYQTTRTHGPEESNLQQHRCENLKCRTLPMLLG